MIDTVTTAMAELSNRRTPTSMNDVWMYPLPWLEEPSHRIFVGEEKATLSPEAAARIKKLQEFDLRFLEEQLTWKDGYSDTLAHECVEEYRKWIALHIAMHDSEFALAYFSGRQVPLGMPSRYIDNAWHRHILFTRDYTAFCGAVAGRMIHHNPCTRRNIATMNSSATQKAYRILFGDMPKIWNAHESFLASANNAGCGCGCSGRD